MDVPSAINALPVHLMLRSVCVSAVNTHTHTARTAHTQRSVFVPHSLPTHTHTHTHAHTNEEEDDSPTLFDRLQRAYEEQVRQYRQQQHTHTHTHTHTETHTHIHEHEQESLQANIQQDMQADKDNLHDVLDIHDDKQQQQVCGCVCVMCVCMRCVYVCVYVCVCVCVRVCDVRV